MLSGILRQGFALAHRRLGFVLLDLLWKALWLGATAAGVFFVIAAYGSQLQSLEWQDSGIPGLNELLAITLLQQFWDTHKADLFWSLAAVLLAAWAIWLALEAFFRSRMTRTNSFNIFLFSGTVKSAVLTASALILGLGAFGGFLTSPAAEWPQLWSETRGAAVAAAAAFAGIAFLSTIFETLIRVNATVLLATDLFRVTGMVAILMLFETMIDAAVVIAIVAAFLNVAGLSGLLLAAGSAVIAFAFVSAVHSYMLLVRFSAVDIMRHNVIEI